MNTDLVEMIRRDALLELRAIGYTVGADDVAMFGDETTQENLFDWADDMEARLDYPVANFRAHLTDFCLARDGAGCPEEADHLETLCASYGLAFCPGNFAP